MLGEAPGEEKVEKAEEQGVSILRLHGYGALPTPKRVLEEAAIELMRASTLKVSACAKAQNANASKVVEVVWDLVNCLRSYCELST